MISTRKASPDDTELLTSLAKEIYQEHYLYLWLPGGAQWYMEEYAYSRDKIKDDLSNAGIEYFIAFDGGHPIAYLKLVLDASLQGYSTTQVLEVERIYVRKSATGKASEND
jgi:predicted metal-dependent hydrolase